MDTMHRCCAGLDIHKETVAVCIRRVDSEGRIHKQMQTFGTMTGDLLRMLDWLRAEANMTNDKIFLYSIWSSREG